ncbi:c-type cytochrome [Adhaeribacter aquaticus]|uniref:c-type cytochrome n=1 Tax=Adhaeribacter aquaticus TaxID=299567 RepID=UPI00047A539D|nr:cytochrome c [Adhaeribacter aquaticus]
MKIDFKIGLKASLVAFSTALVFSCSPDANDPGREYANQMYDDAAYEPLKQTEKNPVNPSGMTMRIPAQGTIARGKLGYYNHIDKNSPEEAGQKLKNPLVANEATLQEGEVLYARFCTPCHGAEGAGDGLVGQKFKGVANLTQDRLKAVSTGYIYHVITHGRGRMMPHGTQVNPEERWKIAMYVKSVLQGQGDAASDGPANVDTIDASTEQNTNQVTGTENPSGGATEAPKQTKQL